MTTVAAHAVMGRVILAVILRETRTRFGKTRLGYLWALFEPLMHTLIFVAIFSAAGRGAPIGDSLTLFLVTGFIPWLLFDHVSGRVAHAIDANSALLIYPQVTPVDLMMARTVLETSTLIIVAVLLLAGIHLVLVPVALDDPLQMTGAVACLVLLSTGIGMVNAAVGTISNSYEHLFGMAKRVLYFVSGTFFSVETLPVQAREILAYNPLLHLVEWFRSGFFVGFQSRFYDWRYPVAFAAIALLAGLVAERAVRRRIGGS
jgi:capsular polysaccharide transport system permease protein